MTEDPRHARGLAGEALAERHLVDEGHRIVARRFRLRMGEIDLVTLDGREVVFVEVRTRGDCSHGRPAQSVDRGKQRRVARTALAYLQRRGWLERNCRFDVVEVLAPAGGEPRLLAHHRGAFLADLSLL